VKLLIAATLLLPPTYVSAIQASAVVEADPAANDIASGIRLLQRNEAAAAKLRFSAGIKANPLSADAFTWRGITENQLKQYDDAIRDFEAALRIDPNELSAHYNLALSLIRVGQANRAIEELRLVLQVQPGVLEPEYNLAVLLEQQHATAEAIEHLKAAYKTRPDDMGVSQHLLIDLLAMGRAEEAQLILEQVQSSASVEARQQLGTVLFEAGDYKQAAILLEGIRAQTESSRDVDLLLARAYIGAQEDFKAIELLKPMETTDSTGETSYLLGMAYAGAGASEEAKNAFQYAIKTNPRNGRALYHLGLIESASPEQMPLALRHVREAIRLEPDNPAYGIALGKLMLQQDEPQEGMIVLQHVHAKGPEAGERDLLLGIAQISASGPKEAVPTLLRAVAENPSLALSYNMLGFCYFQQGDLTKASASYRQASDLSPETRIFAHGAAVALERSNNVDQAMVYAARAVALPTANGEDHFFEGKLLAKTGKKEDAIRELTTAIAMNPDLEESYYLLARTYMQAGDTGRATEWIAKLKELKQKHESADAAARKNAKPVTSSTLLQGAPMASSETGAP
jgi:tetratricopeptide (TPR) repeat protein